ESWVLNAVHRPVPPRTGCYTVTAANCSQNCSRQDPDWPAALSSAIPPAGDVRCPPCVTAVPPSVHGALVLFPTPLPHIRSNWCWRQGSMQSALIIEGSEAVGLHCDLTSASRKPNTIDDASKRLASRRL